MKVSKWLKKVAYLKYVPMDGMKDVPMSWLSKYDDSYITFEGIEKDMQFLADRGITDELTHGVGFSPSENKWYGWSHRAIYGFTIGSTTKKGDCSYRAANIEDELEAAILFWSDENHLDVKASIKEEGIISVTWKYDDTVPNKKLRGSISGSTWHYSLPFGKGEWTAKTMKDAKQMAIDFNEGVS